MRSWSRSSAIGSISRGSSAATVFGALGVLDDVTVTQAATVEQLHHARPDAGRRSVLGRAMRVGRSHIAATVNTLVLAYLGASLPLLLLFALSGEPPLTIANGEIVAVEIVRALVGSIGIVRRSADHDARRRVARGHRRAGAHHKRRPRLTCATSLTMWPLPADDAPSALGEGVVNHLGVVQQHPVERIGSRAGRPE